MPFCLSTAPHRVTRVTQYICRIFFTFLFIVSIIVHSNYLLFLYYLLLENYPLWFFFFFFLHFLVCFIIALSFSFTQFYIFSRPIFSPWLLSFVLYFPSFPLSLSNHSYKYYFPVLLVFFLFLSIFLIRPCLRIFLTRFSFHAHFLLFPRSPRILTRRRGLYKAKIWENVFFLDT